MPDKLNITELDFDMIKDNLVTYFQNVTDETGQKPYQDYDFQGSALNTLMSILAYNTHYNAMTAHMAVNETFIDSAQLRSSVVSAAKLLGYVPRSTTASRSEVNMIITPSLSGGGAAPVFPPTLYVDRDTLFKSSSTYKPYYYTLVDGATFTLNNSTLTYTTDSVIALAEGQRVKKRYPINGSNDYEKYIIDDDNIDISTLIVKVYPNPNDNTNVTVYSRYEDIGTTSPEAPLYYISENTLGKFEITFGNGIISRKPTHLSVLEIEYVVTSGAEANGINGPFTLVNFNKPTNYNGVSLANVNFLFAVTPLTPTSGGSARESVDEIRANATSGFVTQNRAVTADDYVNIITKLFPVVKSVSVWGGEDNDPPQYGKVFISPSKNQVEESDDILSEYEKKQLLNVLGNKKVIAIIPEIVDPEHINIVLDVLFKYNSNITSLSKSQIENNLREGVVTNYNNFQLKGFGAIFRHSEFTKKIDNSDPCILNSHVRVFLSKKAVIDPTSHVHVTLKYGSQLTVDDNIAVSSYSTSQQWTYNGVPLYLADKADATSTDKRILYTYSMYQDGSKYVVHDNIGSITLSTGILALFPLDISDNALSINIDLIPISDDVVSKINQIVKIDVQRCNITGYVDEIVVGGASRSINYQTFKRDR